MLLILILATLTVSAQETSGQSAQAGRKTVFEKNGFWDNWFIGAGAAANVSLGDKGAEADFQSRINFVPTVQVGKWFSPMWGSRLKVEGGRLHNFMNNGNTMLKNNYVNGHVDFMWNVSNTFGRYNEKRFYSFIPYVGIGYLHAWDYDNYAVMGLEDAKTRSITTNAGIINNFRFSNRLSLDVELYATLVKDNLDKMGPGKVNYDAIAGVSASLVYKLGKTGFSEALLRDQAEIDRMNDEINRLRRENAELSTRPERCPKCPEAQTIVKEVKGSAPVNVVFFRLNSSTIDRGQEVTIYNVAKYLQDNPNVKIKVVGYADKKTGTASYNERLSERRAKNVADRLIKKHNINSSRVDVEYKGSNVQPYSTNEWNRVAIFVVQD
ncbi:OmpA family protein [Dysgonomonas sp. 25]|uniref:OmpA family protein n=1 Tax=Dysgonomonas sp. 25 TaxID=2302933 RepID=UPI0021072339|nr:OmpA family protein [Dysgonomonas sp. 25]